MAECLLPDLPLPDVLVPVHPRAEVGLGVIQVERQNLLQSDQRSDLTDRRIPALGCADVVARRKEVGGIQAEAKPLRLLHPVENRREMLDLIPQARPLPRRVLQRDAHGRLPGRGEHLVQAGDDLFDARSLARAQVRARVQHQKRQPQLGGEFDLLDQRLNGAVAIRRTPARRD